MSSRITVYGTSWCPDCKRAKQFLGEVRAGSTKQAASAVGEGATAALMMRQHLA
jgi:glutaredoxin